MYKNIFNNNSVVWEKIIMKSMMVIRKQHFYKDHHLFQVLDLLKIQHFLTAI